MNLYHRLISDRNLYVLIAFILLLSIFDAQAQNYNFNFYNGDVVQSENGIDQRVEKINAPTQVPLAPATPAAPLTPPGMIQPPVTSVAESKDPEKLKRTGIALLAGYSHLTTHDVNGFLTDMNTQSLRGGLSFVSSYDFNVDAEFVGSQVEGNLIVDGVQDNIKGQVPGGSLGLRNNYWLTDGFGLALGANARGMNGKVRGEQNDYKISSIGGALSVGPVFQIGKVQLQLSYEYGLDNITVRGKGDSDFSQSKWAQSSAFRGLLSYRF